MDGLDVYQPGQSGTAPLCTTKIQRREDRRGGGTPAFTEPSISLWVPNDSCTGFSCSA